MNVHLYALTVTLIRRGFKRQRAVLSLSWEEEGGGCGFVFRGGAHGLSPVLRLNQ